jgi:hypothetical protein
MIITRDTRPLSPMQRLTAWQVKYAYIYNNVDLWIRLIGGKNGN